MSVDLTSLAEIKRRLFRRLVHYYGRDDAGKNLHKLLACLSQSIHELGEALAEIKGDWGLSSATGHKLDVLAARYGVYRTEGESDDDLRYRLNTEVWIDTSTGHVNDIKGILGRVLEIPPEEISVYLNSSPSLGIDIIDSFMEVAIPEQYLDEDTTEDIFMFAEAETVPDLDSDYGFDYGRFLYSPDSNIGVEVAAILDEIVAAGVGFTVSAEGGFMFSDWPTVPNLDDDDGFDAGKLSGIII